MKTDDKNEQTTPWWNFTWDINNSEHIAALCWAANELKDISRHYEDIRNTGECLYPAEKSVLAKAETELQLFAVRAFIGDEEHDIPRIIAPLEKLLRKTGLLKEYEKGQSGLTFACRSVFFEPEGCAIYRVDRPERLFLRLINNPGLDARGALNMLRLSAKDDARDPVPM